MKLLYTIILIMLSGKLGFAESYQIQAEKVKVYSDTNFLNEIGYVTKGLVLDNVTAVNSNCYYIVEKGVKGYISSDGVVPLNKEVVKKDNKISYIGWIVGVIVFLALLYLIYGSTERQIVNPSQEADINLESTSETVYIYKSKSVTLAILLTIFLGPLGMFYSTVKGAIIMIISPIVLFVAMLFFIGIENVWITMLFATGAIIYFLLYWFICIIWAGVAASKSVKIKRI